MPRATGAGSHLSRYEEAWEAINRLIRTGGSWSGYERNCFFRGSSSGRFSNLSAASGLDVLDDGRAIAVWDFDRDGDPDLLVKNRTAPQLRIWRNDSPSGPARIKVRLRARGSNTQAIGARVTVEAGGQRRVKELRAGSGFLSQCSAELFFGLGAAERVDRLTVRWPTGAEQTFAELPVGVSIDVREGLRQPRVERFRVGDPLPPATEAVASEAGRVTEAPRRPWIIDPAPLPDLAVRGLDGRELPIAAPLGRPWILNLWAVDCVRCLKELDEWSRERRPDDPPVLALTADGASQAERLREISRRARVAVASTSPEELLALAIRIEDLVRWPRELRVPLSLLVDGEGRIVRLYEGAVSFETLRADAASIPSDLEQRQRRGLPFAGEYHASDFFRNEFQLGVSYLEAGLPRHALATFEGVLAQRPDETEALYNVGLIRLEAGDLEGARRTFARVVAVREEFVDAWVNLGVAEARSGLLDQAATRFERVLALRPGHVEALVDLGNVELERGRVTQAVEAFEAAVESEPEFAAAHGRLGAARRSAGDLAGARRALEAATRLAPDDAPAWSDLAVVRAESGDLRAAWQACEEAIRADPALPSVRVNGGLILAGLGRLDDAEEQFRAAIALDAGAPIGYLQLARLQASRGRTKAARETLTELLRRVPDEPRALRLLREIGE